MFYLVRREALITDRDIRSAQPGLDAAKMPDVEFRVAPSAAHEFERATAANVGSRIAIVIDGIVNPRDEQTAQQGDI